VLPYFKELEIDTDLARPFHERSGPVPVHRSDASDPHTACGSGKPCQRREGGHPIRRWTPEPRRAAAQWHRVDRTSRRSPYRNTGGPTRCRNEAAGPLRCRCGRLSAPVGRLLDQEPHHLQVPLRCSSDLEGMPAGDMHIAGSQRSHQTVDNDHWRRRPIFGLGRRDR
jgi:hypothetical protein